MPQNPNEPKLGAIRHQGKTIPVVAFFGTKGGVGKTTIAKRFAELVTMSPSSPNVLAVDLDVDHRGLTVTLAKNQPFICKTIHDYIADRDNVVSDAVDVTLQIERRGARAARSGGRLIMLPASTPEAKKIFAVIAKISYKDLLNILSSLLISAVEKYNISCVVIDCGPIINPYTAGAAQLADRAFIIGQNEPISFASLGNYAQRIQEIYPDFTTTKMKIIINKVRGWEQLQERQLQTNVFHAIPFTIDIVDVGEGVQNIDEMRLLMFEDHIVEIIRKIFEGDHPELIPEKDALLPPEWNGLVQKADSLEKAPRLKRLGWLRLLIPLGLLLMVLGTFFFFSAKVPAATISKGVDTTTVKDPELLRQIREEQMKIQTARDQQNIGIVLMAGGLLIFGFGLSIGQRRRSYMKTIHNLKTGGADWLMRSLKGSRRERVTLDRLRRIAAKI